jgi:tripartite ATP-independent transporter DctP family solute receptor
MKKQILCSFLVLVMGLFFMVPFALGKVIIKVGHVDRGNRQDSTLQAFASTFKDIVESQSGGEMEVLIYPGAQLGNMREMVESTQMGAIQIALCFTSVASIFSPKAELPMAPFIFPTAAHAWYAIDGWFGKELAEAILRDSKLRVLVHGETNGFRDFWIAKRPIRKPGDLKGLKIRVPESKMLMTLISSLGASPTVIPSTETYTSMQTGLVDGCEIEAGGVVDQKLYEIVKYGTLTHHGYTSCYMLANDDWFKKLSSKDKEIVIHAARIAVIANRGASQNNYGNHLSFMKSRGIEIYSPTKEELKEFIKVSQPPCLSYLEKNVGKEWVQKLLRASREAEEALALK